MIRKHISKYSIKDMVAYTKGKKGSSLTVKFFSSNILLWIREGKIYEIAKDNWYHRSKEIPEYTTIPITLIEFKKHIKKVLTIEGYFTLMFYCNEKLSMSVCCTSTNQLTKEINLFIKMNSLRTLKNI